MAAFATRQPLSDSYPWYALRVRSHFERTTSNCLKSKGYEEFTPFYRTKRRWSDRIKEVEFPLFPGYVLCRFNPQQRLPILQTPGVVCVVSFGKQPAAVDDEEIAVIQALVRSSYPARPWPFLRVGQKARIVGGPLHGLEGLLLDLKNGCRIVLAVNLLQRSVAVEIDRENVEPVL